MSATILSRTISAVVDKKLVLANDQAARLLAIGSTWNTIRLGMRLAIDDAGLTSNLAGEDLRVGLCSGTANKVGNATTTNFFGLRLSTSLVYVAGPPIYLHLGGASGFTPSKKVGATTTDGSALVSSSTCGFSGAPGTARTALVLEIVKGSPNWTVQLVHTNDATSLQTDIPYTTLVAALEATTMANATTAIAAAGGSWSNSLAVALAFDETAGSLNAFNIFWNSSSRPLEISEVLYARIA